MIDFKQKLAEELSKQTNIPENETYELLEIPTDEKLGDFSLPCFKLAKIFKKSPQIIAEELKENLHFEEGFIKKVEVVGGYLNFYIADEIYVKNVLTEIANKQENYGSSNIGNGKNIVIDYSSPNIAKPFHIGHLRSTVIGNSLYKTYQFLGYHCTGINYLGDWGTQFGKLIEGYKRWGEEYHIEENPIDELTKIYVRINELAKEDESVLEACRDNFKKLEDGDEYCTKIWKRFRELSLKEFQRIYDMLGTTFDSWNGESFYSDKMPEIIDILNKTGKLVESQGAKIIDLEDKGINTPCIIEKSNGSSTYATRDLAAIMYRARTYDFDKALYLTSYEQALHFKQVFEVTKLLGLDEKYTNGLEHVSFGMVLLPTGKMSTREGTSVKLSELLNESISRAKAIIEEKNPDLKNKDEVARKVGVGAVIFNDLANSRIKDEIFDWDTILNFQGETGPYIQYTYVRTKSVVEKAGGVPDISEVNTELLQDEYSIRLAKLIYEFEDVLVQVTDKNEPSILSRYLIDVAKAYSNFYNENKIINEDKALQDARVYLTYSVGRILKTGAGLLGIEMPDKM